MLEIRVEKNSLVHKLSILQTHLAAPHFGINGTTSSESTEDAGVWGWWNESARLKINVLVRAFLFVDLNLQTVECNICFLMSTAADLTNQVHISLNSFLLLLHSFFIITLVVPKVSVVISFHYKSNDTEGIILVSFEILDFKLDQWRP